MKKRKLISKIWENIQINTFFETNEEKRRISGDVYKCFERLKSTLNKNEILMLDEFEELVYAYCKISEEDAFVSGIRFATRYLLEAQSDKDEE